MRPPLPLQFGPARWLSRITFIIGLTFLAAARRQPEPRQPVARARRASSRGGSAAAVPADLQFLALTVLALGTGAIVAAFMNRIGYDISAMSVAATVVAFGAFVLAVQQGVPVIGGGNVYVYGAMFIAGGIVAVAGTLRPPRLPS